MTLAEVATAGTSVLTSAVVFYVAAPLLVLVIVGVWRSMMHWKQGMEHRANKVDKQLADMRIVQWEILERIDAPRASRLRRYIGDDTPRVP